MAGGRLSTLLVPLIVFYEYLTSNYRYLAKNILISMFIVAYTLTLHYPTMVWYDFYVGSLEASGADYMIRVQVDVGDVGSLASLLEDRGYEGLEACSGVESLMLAFVAYHREATLILASGDLGLAPVKVVEGRMPGSSGEIMVSVLNSSGVDIGSTYRIGGRDFRVTGKGYINPILSAHALGDRIALTLLGDDTLDLLAVDTGGAPYSGGVVPGLIFARGGGDPAGCIGAIAGSIGAGLRVDEVVDLGSVVEHDKQLYKNEYGSWETTRLAASMILVLYMVRVALTDVSEKMRRELALLYGMGGGDLLAGSLLALKFLLLGVAISLLGLALSSWYMEESLLLSLPLPYLLREYSTLLSGALGAGLLLSVLAGVLAARRSNLVEVYSGA